MLCGHVQDSSYFLYLKHLREYSYFQEVHVELFKDKGTSYLKVTLKVGQTVTERERNAVKRSHLKDLGKKYLGIICTILATFM